MRKFHPSLFILHYSFFIIVSLFTFGCPKSTAPKTGSLSGHINLINDTNDPFLDPADFSGVTVALYEPVVLDTTIVRINQEYPNIGVQISQETEFDHRLQSPLSVTTTNAGGDFKFYKVVQGTYNLVMMKQGWGVRYLYGVPVNEEGKNSNILTQLVELYPEKIYSGSVMDFIEFMSFHSYIISNDAIFVKGCKFHDNSLIMVGSSANLSISETIEHSSTDQYWRITALDGMYEAEKLNSIVPFNKLFLDYITSPKLCKNMIMSYATNGISSGPSKTTFENIVIRESASSAMVLNSNDSTVSSALIYRCNAKGITTYGKAHIEKSMFAYNHESCMLYEFESTIEDSYFHGSYLGIRCFMNPQIMRYNCFDKNDVAIAPSGSSPSIEYNNFYDNKRDVELNRGGSTYGPVYCSPYIQRNNFLGDKFYVHLKGDNSVHADGGYGSWIGVSADQHYPNNYWKAVNLVNHIYDANYPNSSTSYTVTCLPRLSHANPQSGIRPYLP